MKNVDCDALRELDCELALNLLSGADRARAVSHLERCPTCRAEVASLAAAADELLELAPRVEPPPGFESRVLRALAAEQGGVGTDAEGSYGRPHAARASRRPHKISASRAPRRPRRSRRIVLGLAAAALLLAVAAIGLLVPRSDGPRTATAAMRTPGSVVGAATVRAEPPAVVVDLHGWTDVVRSYPTADTGTARVRIRYRDGSRTVVPLAVPATASWHRTWRIPAGHDSGDVTSVAIVGRDGQVWCSARLT